MLDLTTIVKRSFNNCHAIGLNSIILDQKPDGHLVRMFYTTPDHVLWKNEDIYSPDLTIAFHSHHTNIGISVVKGEITNITAKAIPTNQPSCIKGWDFQSQILTGRGLFSEQDQKYELTDVKKDKGKCFFMDSTQLHTVFVERGECCAWIINEEQGIGYNPTGYSNSDLKTFKFEDHYLPLSEEEVILALGAYFIP